MTKEAKDLLLTIIAVVSFIITVVTAGDQFLSNRESGRAVAGLELFATAVILGIVASIIQGVSWALIESSQGWDFGAGGGTRMPTGIQAVILSLTLTIPLLALPIIYQAGSGRHIMLDHHLSRSCMVVAGMAVAHIFMYGTASPKLSVPH